MVPMHHSYFPFPLNYHLIFFSSFSFSSVFLSYPPFFLSFILSLFSFVLFLFSPILHLYLPHFCLSYLLFPPSFFTLLLNPSLLSLHPALPPLPSFLLFLSSLHSFPSFSSYPPSLPLVLLPLRRSVLPALSSRSGMCLSRPWCHFWAVRGSAGVVSALHSEINLSIAPRRPLL